MNRPTHRRSAVPSFLTVTAELRTWHACLKGPSLSARQPFWLASVPRHSRRPGLASSSPPPVQLPKTQSPAPFYFHG